MSMLDSTWVVNSSNGLHAHGHPAWLHLQLAACKLLDLALLLPAHRLPQFQMYRWAFVGSVGITESGGRNDGDDDCSSSEGDDKVRSPEFVPHVTRIARLMNKKLNKHLVENPVSGGKLLLTMSSIRSIKELHSFFTALSESNFSTSAICSSASLSYNALNSTGLGSRRDAADASIVYQKDGSESASICHIEAVLESDFLEQILK
ncbi:hypothetical protein J437_LFUL000366 [Ladona fulva]|uniref:Uncharacterized protein n=1 Tax=Ladona fulva TaxID=123851 RepID=A0A8K0JWM0_LADFU|nr:hypothetical protein J437_LFUL000366 [Ladona fulva]